MPKKTDKPKRERKYGFNVIRQEYNGIRFRSRLEARWAIFFDAMDVPYVYEPEGVVLWRGGVYLPDFYLPRHHGGCYAEVKPTEFTEDEAKKCRMLARMTEQWVLLLDGHPEPITYAAYSFERGLLHEHDVVLHAECTQTERRFFVDSGFTDRREVVDWATPTARAAFRRAMSLFSWEGE